MADIVRLAVGPNKGKHGHRGQRHPKDKVSFLQSSVNFCKALASYLAYLYLKLFTRAQKWGQLNQYVASVHILNTSRHFSDRTAWRSA